MPRRLLVNYFPQEKCTSVWRPATVLGQTILPVSAYFCFPCTRGRSWNIQCPKLNKLTGISNSWFLHIMKWKFVQKQELFNCSLWGPQFYHIDAQHSTAKWFWRASFGSKLHRNAFYVILPTRQPPINPPSLLPRRSPRGRVILLNHHQHCG